jgi:hypothetical protein
MFLLLLFLQAYGYEMPKDIEYIYTNVRKTHNSGVFDAYTDEMKRARKSGILTGLPDGYGELACRARASMLSHTYVAYVCMLCSKRFAAMLPCPGCSNFARVWVLRC